MILNFLQNFVMYFHVLILWSYIVAILFLFFRLFCKFEVHLISCNCKKSCIYGNCTSTLKIIRPLTNFWRKRHICKLLACIFKIDNPVKTNQTNLRGINYPRWNQIYCLKKGRWKEVALYYKSKVWLYPSRREMAT